MSFQQLNLPDYLFKAIDLLEYKTPTRVQAESYSIVLKGGDLLAEAPTGSGKTAAYILPLIQQFNENKSEEEGGAYALILVPTRELALQVASSIKSYARFSPRNIKVIALIGGEKIGNQIQSIEAGCDFVIATPGRLLDLVKRNSIGLESIQCLVLDEADKLLDLGFADELSVLLSLLPVKRQSLLFSATLKPNMVALGSQFLNQAEQVRVSADSMQVGELGLRVIEVNQDRRRPLLQHLIESEDWQQIIVFVSSKRGAHNLASKLRVSGCNAVALHGDLPQADRSCVLKDFKAQKFPVLVATDLAARGIDVAALSCVVNYDLPRSPKDFIHRAGRTGRAGLAGMVLSFVDAQSQGHLKVIAKHCKLELKPERVDGFEYSEGVQKTGKGPAAVKGKGMSKKDRLRAEAVRLKAESKDS